MVSDTITPAGYLPRIVDGQMRSALETMPAVVVEGPRACGKTWTGRRFARSAVFLDERVEEALSAGMDPGGLLDGETPRLLDEWQLAPGAWNPMRRACDDRGLKGQFILTGSADPPDDITRHSGAGRIIRVRMRPMSLFESGDSDGRLSLGEILDGGPCRTPDQGYSLEHVLGLACRGGWPQHIGSSVETAGDAARAYLAEITRTDVSRVDRVERSPLKVQQLLLSIARNVARDVKYTTLAADTAPGNGQPELERRTVPRYLDALERLFVVERVPAWRPHLASRAQARKAPKLHLTDPSLTVAVLDTRVDGLMRDLRFAGRLFESMVTRDLQVYAGANRATVSHYRDSQGLEVDLVMTQPDGRWAAVEVKLGGHDAIDKAAASLLRLRARVDSATHGAPSRLIVVTATGYAFERPDGVCVIPITSLGP